MKREKLICCKVIVRQDRCTVLHLCFQALYQLVGHEVPGVVAVLCENIAGPHQLIAVKT